MRAIARMIMAPGEMACQAAPRGASEGDLVFDTTMGGAGKEK